MPGFDTIPGAHRGVSDQLVYALATMGELAAAGETASRLPVDAVSQLADTAHEQAAAIFNLYRLPWKHAQALHAWAHWLAIAGRPREVEATHRAANKAYDELAAHTRWQRLPPTRGLLTKQGVQNSPSLQRDADALRRCIVRTIIGHGMPVLRAGRPASGSSTSVLARNGRNVRYVGDRPGRRRSYAAAAAEVVESPESRAHGERDVGPVTGVVSGGERTGDAR